MTLRQWGLCGALALTVAATLWAALQEEDALAASSSRMTRNSAAYPAVASSPPRVRAQALATTPSPTARLPLLPEASNRLPLAEEGAAFAAPLSFRPPAPPAPPPPPPRPQAPPLPFRYLGAIVDDGVRSALLAEGEQLRIVRRGEEISGRYRVEQIDENRIDFVYLPLKQRQSMPLPRS